MNERPLIELRTLVARALAIVENVAKLEVHVPENGDRAIE